MATTSSISPSSQFDRELEERLVRYVQIDTTSDENSPTSPSTAKQLDFQNLLIEELNQIGAKDVTRTGYGAVIATIPATIAGGAPKVAFLGHVDTTAGFNGTGVKPIVHRAYAGGDITLPDDPAMVITTAQFPYLATKTGDDIITASGTTLLGADDKAGVAVVMAAATYLLAHPELPHGEIRLAFTPDEEIGRGVDKQLPADLGVDVAYTFDGGPLGEICYETFSADQAIVTIQGVSIHPGQAKDQLVNALKLAARIIDTLPVNQSPETTDGRQGFIHPYVLQGSAATATISFIIRDFGRAELQAHGDLLKQICATIQATEPRAVITCEIRPQYRNMYDWLEQDMRPVELANQAATDLGLTPFAEPIRGGTDGSRLTEMGVPTPNLFTGMQGIHGPLEWISVQDMARATELCIRLAELWGEQSS